MRRRKESQEAEYHNLKESMATGCTEEETCIERTADRGNREEGKRKVRELSSLKRTEMDERKSKGRRKSRQRNGRKEVDRGEHRWNGCGSETGKDERKQTESQVSEPRRNA